MPDGLRVRGRVTDQPSVASSSLPRVRVLSHSEMLKHAKAFNQTITNWDTSKVTNMQFVLHVATCSMVSGCEDTRPNSPSVASSSLPRTRPLSHRGTFYYALAFDQPITDWDTSKVTGMQFVLRAAAECPMVSVCVEHTPMVSVCKEGAYPEPPSVGPPPLCIARALSCAETCLVGSNRSTSQFRRGMSPKSRACSSCCVLPRQARWSLCVRTRTLTRRASPYPLCLTCSPSLAQYHAQWGQSFQPAHCGVGCVTSYEHGVRVWCRRCVPGGLRVRGRAS